MKSQSVVLAMLLVGCAAKGTAGPPGADGAKGMDGAQGPVGPAGPAGPAGPMGAKGPAGADGMPGAQGPIGMQGPAGMTGPAGPPGTPADVSKLVDLASAQTIAGAKTFSATVTATGDITANGYSLTAGQQNVRSIVNKAAANGFCPAGQTAIYTPWSMRGKTGAAICAADARGKTNCGAVKFVYVAADNTYGAYGPNDLGCTQTVDYPWPWGVDYQTPDTLDSEWSHGNTYVVCCF